MIRFFTTCLLILLVSCQSPSGHDAPVASQATVPTPVLSTFNDAKGIRLEDYHGKAVFLNFWATWCKPCQAEMPSIAKAKELLGDSNVVFLFASDEAVEDVALFRQQHTYPFHYVKAENVAELGIMALPTTMIFNSAGELVFNESGVRQWDDSINIALIRQAIRTK